MFGFIERIFLKTMQIIGVLLAIIILIMAVRLGYDNISIKNEKADAPVIKFVDYQRMTALQEKEIAKNLDNNQRFNETFNAHIDNIVGALGNLSDKVVDKDNLKQKVKVSSKIKTNQYPQNIKLSYVASLEKLTNQVATVGIEVNIDELTSWHDRSFFQQIQEKRKTNFVKIGSIKIEQNTYSALWEALIIFAILIIMIAVLRIEKNTRKTKKK